MEKGIYINEIGDCGNRGMGARRPHGSLLEKNPNRLENYPRLYSLTRMCGKMGFYGLVSKDFGGVESSPENNA